MQATPAPTVGTPDEDVQNSNALDSTEAETPPADEADSSATDTVLVDLKVFVINLT